MTDTDKMATKEKILTEASKLFARFGYNGASVREIANASGVNIAAVNYHFGSKHNLYWAVIEDSYQWCVNGIKEISERSNSLEEMTVEFYLHVISNKDFVRTIFKIMLTEGVPEPEGQAAPPMAAKEGPPGFDYFVEAIEKEVGSDINEEAKIFAVESIMGMIFHIAMICSSSKADLTPDDPFLKPEQVEKTLRHQVRAVCLYLKQNPTI